MGPLLLLAGCSFGACFMAFMVAISARWGFGGAAFVATVWLGVCIYGVGTGAHLAADRATRPDRRS